MNAPYAENRLREGAEETRSFRESEGPSFSVKRRRLILWVGLVLLVCGFLVWLIRPASHVRTSPAGASNDAIPVGIATAKSGDVRVTLDALGTVTPLATVTVKPEVSGIIQKVDFREGQMVRAGDLLAEIDPRPFQAALDQAKGTLARDEAQYANAQIDLKRYQALLSQNAISQQILATQEALARTDAGTVESDKGAVEAAAVNLGFCKITSPVAGRAGLRQVDQGNYVQVGVTTEIVVVTQLQPMSVLFTLPEDDIARVMKRVRAGDSLTADAYDRSQSVKIASGKLATVDNEIDPTTGTVKLRALFDNTDLKLFPSQFVNIRLLIDTLHRQTIVPGAAIQHGTSGNYVFAVNPESAVSMRSVTLGPTDGDNVDVTRGLAPGDRIVVDGADRLKDGSRVLLPGTKNYSRLGGEGSSQNENSKGQHDHHRSSGGDGGGE